MVQAGKLSDYVEGIRRGDIRWISKAITLVEAMGKEGKILLEAIYPERKVAEKIGCTGPPGAGKSSLIGRLIPYFHREGHKIAVLGIDPTSPISGGALLGDRVRMQEQLTQYDVYMRSLATRGSWGGMPFCLPSVIHILEAAGYSLLFLESVGAGQDQIDLAHISDTLLLVLIPESGDTIQGMKAGLNEMADIFIVHKADREGTETLLLALQEAIQLTHPNSGWIPPVLPVSSAEGTGLPQLVEQIQKHRHFLQSSGLLEGRRRQQLQWEILALFQHSLLQRMKQTVEEFISDDVLEQIISAKISPYAISQKLEDSLYSGG